VDECKPLAGGGERGAGGVEGGGGGGQHGAGGHEGGRGLLSSTFRLNVSAFCYIGGTFEGCLGDV